MGWKSEIHSLRDVETNLELDNKLEVSVVKDNNIRMWILTAYKCN